MPRFYFDFRDGHGTAEDDTGIELASTAAARREVARILPEVGKDVLPGASGDRREIVLRVRDEAGQQVLTATLTLVVRLSG